MFAVFMCKNNATDQTGTLGHSGKYFSWPQGAAKAAEVPGSALNKPDLERETVQQGPSAVLQLGGCQSCALEQDTPAWTIPSRPFTSNCAAPRSAQHPLPLTPGTYRPLMLHRSAHKQKLYSFWSFPSITNMYWENQKTLLVCWLIFAIIYYYFNILSRSDNAGRPSLFDNSVSLHLLWHSIFQLKYLRVSKSMYTFHVNCLTSQVTPHFIGLNQGLLASVSFASITVLRFQIILLTFSCINTEIQQNVPGQGSVSGKHKGVCLF